VITLIIGFILFGIAVWKIKEKFTGMAIVIGALPPILIFVRPETLEGIYSIALIILNLGLLRLSYMIWSAKS
jgi:VIT1/CCC1 family predicted Fe2+/Mn2+ transporter